MASEWGSSCTTSRWASESFPFFSRPDELLFVLYHLPLTGVAGLEKTSSGSSHVSRLCKPYQFLQTSMKLRSE